jgi:ABC-type spermidine/putrescine transport system permease subunit I
MAVQNTVEHTPVITAVAPDAVLDVVGLSPGQSRLISLSLLAPVIFVMIVFLLLPMFYIGVMSFTEGQTFLSPAPVYTLENYSLMFTRYLPNLWTSIRLAGLATLVDVVFGFPFAYILVRKVQYRDLVRATMTFPMFGALYLAFGMRFILLPGGLLDPVLKFFGLRGTAILYGTPSVVLAMALFTFPLTVMNMVSAFNNIDPMLEQAASSLGAKPWQVFWRIVVPLSRSGIIAGALMSFGWNLGAFAEPMFLGTLNEQKVLSWTLYQTGLVQSEYGLAATMGIVLMVVASAVTYISLRFSRGALAA